MASTWYLGKNLLIRWGSIDTVGPGSLVPRHQVNKQILLTVSSFTSVMSGGA
jgi:hypothetical protein